MARLNPMIDSPEDFIAQITSFKDFGSETLVQDVNGTSHYVNEFWTSKQRQANRIHEVSYRACFKPQLPAFFIDRLTNVDDIVYDPFMGRGTTPIESALKKRVPYGNDTNPLSKALTEPRVTPPCLSDIKSRLSAIPWHQFNSYAYDDLLAFYHPETLAKLEGLRTWFIEREKKGDLDNIDKWIRMVAINRLTGHSSGFFSVYTLPPNQAVSIERQKKINEQRNQIPPYRDLVEIIIRKSKILLSSGIERSKDNFFITAQSHDTHQIPDNVVSLTVTSPPFLDIVDYESDNWLRCWFLNIDPKSVNISQHRNVDDWQAFIRETLIELARITKLGGHIAFEVGEVRNGTIRLEENVIKAAKDLPLQILGVMINSQKFTKTSNCWGVSNNLGGVNSNRIVIFKKVENE